MAKQSNMGCLVAFVRGCVVTCVLLLLLLIGFQSIWVIGGSGTAIMDQCDLQRIRAQAIAKDVLILSYRATDERAIAIGELQTTLPRYEQTERGLQAGDSSLQLPGRIPSDVEQAMIVAQPDFLAMDTATRAILAHPDAPLDPVQRDIILAHVSDYSTTMMQVQALWQQHLDDAFLHIFWIESAITALAILLVLAKYFLGAHRLIHMIEKGGY